jgi:ATP-dependent Clp protease ATP-binding subunit ClpA
VFERFTPRARHVLVLAQNQAQGLNHTFIGTEHLLLGLIAEGEGIGARVLASFGLSRPVVEAKVSEATSPGRSAAAGARKPPFTPGSKKVLECSLREALELGHNYIGTEHLLLGLLRESDGVAAQLLVDSGVSLAEARSRVLDTLNQGDLPVVSGLPRRLSDATRQALSHAARLAKGQPLTTGQVLAGLLAVDTSHGALALAALGVTRTAVEAKLAAIPVESTSDAAGPQTVEIKLGRASTVISDPELAAALQHATAEELQQVLRQLVPGGPGAPSPVDEPGRHGPDDP